MWGTFQRSRRTVTGAPSPSSSILPLVFGSGRRAEPLPGRGEAEPGKRRPDEAGEQPVAGQRRLAAAVHGYSLSPITGPIDLVELASRPGSRPSASSFARWASITIAAAAVQLGRDVVPGLGQQRPLRALAALQRREQPALAHLAVLDVLGQLRLRVLDPGPVPGADQLDPLLPQPASEPM